MWYLKTVLTWLIQVTASQKRSVFDGILKPKPCIMPRSSEKSCIWNSWPSRMGPIHLLFFFFRQSRGFGSKSAKIDACILFISKWIYLWKCVGVRTVQKREISDGGLRELPIDCVQKASFGKNTHFLRVGVAQSTTKMFICLDLCNKKIFVHHHQ